MPEIKEIRYYADFIRKKIKNQEIINIKIINGRYKTHSPFTNYNLIKKQLPIKVLDVKTKGKFIYIILENNLFLFNTLGLSGGWCYQKKNSNKYEFSKNLDNYSLFLSKEQIDSFTKNSLNHLNVEFETKKGSLYFFDVLSFGTIKIVNSIDELNNKLNKIGPDIMDDNTTLELFTQQIQKHNGLEKEIGNVLVNQKIISGIGNYLRSEILYLSKINPFRKVKKLTEKEIKDIYNNSKILTWYDYKPSKVKKFKIINKLIKNNKLFFIYSQKKDIYNNDIIKKELYEGSQKRFIYYVPKLQK